MKILHIVALITPDNVYGGPVTVALNQCEELRRRGHDVFLAAAYRGYNGPPEVSSGGVPLRLFKARQALPKAGFAGLTSPELLRFVQREAHRFDVVHVHLARDLLTLPAAALALKQRVKLVLQPHGMIDPSDRWLAKPLDLALTRRVLKGADTVFHLTDDEASWLHSVVGGKSLRLQLLPNGVQVPDEIPPFPDRLQVLYCARLHPRKRPSVFIEAAAQLIAEGVDADFTLVGADEGEGRAVIAQLAELGNNSVRWLGPVSPERVRELMEKSVLIALPAVDEPFPMAVIEALALGRPVLITDTCGLAHIVASGGGEVVDDTQASFTNAMRRALQRSGQSKSSSAHALASAHLSIVAVGQQLELSYESRGPQARVVIVQPYVPTYRLAMFTQLRERLAIDGIDLRIVAGSPGKTQAARRDADDAEFIDRVGSWSIPIGRHSVRLKRVGRHVRDADLVISELSAGALENYWLTWTCRGRHALWGHVYATVGIQNRIDQALEGWLMRRAVHVFAYTDKGGKAARAAGVSASGITVLRNTIDTASLQEAIEAVRDSDTEAFRQKYDVGTGPIAASIGALDDSKRLGFLMDAIDGIQERIPDLQMFIAGDGPGAGSIRRYANMRPRVHYLGRIDDADKAIIAKNALILLNPGRVGLLAVESLVMGTPIVTTDWAHHGPEFEYLRTGQNALVVPDSVRTFVESTTRLIRDSNALKQLQRQAQADAGNYLMTSLVDRFVLGIKASIASGLAVSVDDRCGTYINDDVSGS